jgi:hypothetical protein
MDSFIIYPITREQYPEIKDTLERAGYRLLGVEFETDPNCVVCVKSSYFPSRIEEEFFRELPNVTLGQLKAKFAHPAQDLRSLANYYRMKGDILVAQSIEQVVNKNWPK